MCNKYDENRNTENIENTVNPETNETRDTAEAEPINSAAENETAKASETPAAPETPVTSEDNGAAAKPTYRYNEPWTEPKYSQTTETKYNYYSPNYSAGHSYGYAAGKKQQHNSSAASEPKKRRGGFARALALVLVCVLLCAGTGIGTAYYMIDRYLAENTSENSGTNVILGNQNASNVSSGDSSEDDTDATVQSGDELSGTEIYKLAETQVVGITTPYTTQNLFGMESTNAVTGTGFVISEDGYIITNYHVIELAVENGYDVNVMFKDGTEYVADIVGYYEDNDVAVIKIDATGLTPVTLGDSDEMEVGERVYCVGNPLGELDFSFTSGYLSALDRMIATDDYTTINMFQMDAAVNSGNSGGPVYNSQGEVIGIVTAKYSESGVEGLGFAIPINDAINIASDLIEYGYLAGQAYLGVNVSDVEMFVTSYYNIPNGAYVNSVEEGSCAEAAGIRAQDIITAIDGTPIGGIDELRQTLRNYSAGDTATITIYRSSVGTTDVTVVFDENTQGAQ